MPRWNFDFSGGQSRQNQVSPDFSFPFMDFTQPNRPMTTNNPGMLPDLRSTQSRPETLSAYDRFMQTSNEMPIYGDKQYSLGKWGKLGAVLAGVGSTALSGDVNSGLNLGQRILDNKFNRAYADWGARYKTDAAAAKEERAQDEQARKNKNTDAQTALYGAQTDELETKTPLIKQEKEADIRATLARAGHDEAQTQKVLDDLKNPEVTIQKNNRGGVDVYDRGGNIIRTHQNINLSDQQLKNIDFAHDTALTKQRGDIGENNLRVQLGGFSDLSKQSFLQGVARDRELESFRQSGRQKLQDDAQEFKATHPGDVTRNLTNPQFNRQFKMKMSELSQDPRKAEVISRTMQMDDKGNIMPAPGVDMNEYLEVYNLIASEALGRK